VYIRARTQVYSKNGRIGIYTPQERAAIIARFNEKRSHRNWNKKIRYNCRKSLADRRLRVKGRFVKRSEQELLKKVLAEAEEEEYPVPEDQGMPDVNDPEAGFAPTEDQPYRRLRRHTVT
jgi:CCT motif